MKSRLVSIISAIVTVLFICVIWVMEEKSNSYAEPHEALLAIDKNMSLIPAYKSDDRALFFVIKSENNLGAAYVKKDLFGWKSGMLTASPMAKDRIYDNLAGYQGHGENLIYGLIRHGDDRMVQVGDNYATILNLAMLPPEEVEKYRLEGLHIWYLESDDSLNNEKIKLIDKMTEKVLDQHE